MRKLRKYYLRCLRVTQYLPLHTKKEIGDIGHKSERILQGSCFEQNSTPKLLEIQIGDLPQVSGPTVEKVLNTADKKIAKTENAQTLNLAARQINNLLIICEVEDRLLSDRETGLLKNILRSLEVYGDVSNFEVVKFTDIPSTLDDNFLTSVFKQFVDRSDVTSGLGLGLKNHWRMSVGEDRSDTSLNRFELPNGLKIALISDLTTMLGEPKEKKRAWNTLRSRPEIGQKVFN